MPQNAWKLTDLKRLKILQLCRLIFLLNCLTSGKCRQTYKCGDLLIPSLRKGWYTDTLSVLSLKGGEQKEGRPAPLRREPSHLPKLPPVKHYNTIYIYNTIYLQRQYSLNHHRRTRIITQDCPSCVSHPPHDGQAKRQIRNKECESQNQNN